MKLEKRSIEKSIREIQPDEGIVDAYLTAWETVDSYKTSFQRGSFSKTFENRAHKIRLLWNHDTLAGKCLEAREDEYGAFVRVQFNLDTEVGRTAFAHIKAGDVDAFSFGFNVVNDKWIDGIRTFTEVKCLECSPVMFPANEAAVITDVRAENFDETVISSELYRRGWQLLSAIERTLDDIIWENPGNIDAVIEKTDIAISKFHSAYMDWLSENYAFFGSTNGIRCKENPLTQAILNNTIGKDIVSETSLTISDLAQMRDGKLINIESRSKLAELPEEIRVAHQTHRADIVKSLCDELRHGGFSAAEKTRFIALLNIDEPEEIDTTINFIKNLRRSL